MLPTRQTATLKALGKIEGFNRELIAFLDRRRAEGDNFIIAMGSVFGLHNILLG